MRYIRKRNVPGGWTKVALKHIDHTDLEVTTAAAMLLRSEDQADSLAERLEKIVAALSDQRPLVRLDALTLLLRLAVFERDISPARSAVEALRTDGDRMIMSTANYLCRTFYAMGENGESADNEGAPSP